MSYAEGQDLYVASITDKFEAIAPLPIDHFTRSSDHSFAIHDYSNDSPVQLPGIWGARCDSIEDELLGPTRDFGNLPLEDALEAEDVPRYPDILDGQSLVSDDLFDAAKPATTIDEHIGSRFEVKESTFLEMLDWTCKLISMIRSYSC